MSDPSGAASGLVALYVSATLGSCLWFIMLAYNVGALFSFIRNKGDDKPSGLSMAAWAVGFLSFLLGPCAWFGAILAMVLANVERRRIFQDKSTFASATPCRHASVNSGFTLLMWVLITGGLVLTWLSA